MNALLIWNDILILVCLIVIIKKLYPGKKKPDTEVEDDDIK